MNEKIIILAVIICLLPIAIPMLIIYANKRKRRRIVRRWGSPKPATKYRELSFDQKAGLYLIQADVYFTRRNACPIIFQSSDGEEILADVHFSYVESENNFKSSNSIVRIEAVARRILTEELKDLTKELNSDDITGHSFKHIKALRFKFKKRMREFVRDVEYLFLIGDLHMVDSPSPESMRNFQ